MFFDESWYNALMLKAKVVAQITEWLEGLPDGIEVEHGHVILRVTHPNYPGQHNHTFFNFGPQTVADVVYNIEVLKLWALDSPKADNVYAGQRTDAP